MEPFHTGGAAMQDGTRKCTWYNAVAVSCGEDIDTVVGHLPRNISTPCHLFLRKGGIKSCVVNGARRYSIDLVQGGLEVPCHLVFQGSPRDVDNMKKMLQDVPLKQPEVEWEQKNEHTPVQK